MDTVQLGAVTQRWARLDDQDGQAVPPGSVTTVILPAGKAPTPGQWLTPTGIDATSVAPALRVAATLTASTAGTFSLWVRVVSSTETLVLRVDDVLVVDQAAAFATVEDLPPLLGPYGRDLPDWLDVGVHLRAAHARALALLAGTYGDPLPVLAGPGLEVVRYAEAQLAAASVLSSLQTQLVAGSGGTATVEQLRTDGLRTLGGRVPGLTVDDPDGDGPLQPPARPTSVGWNRGGSLVRDPYADVDHRPRAWSSLDPGSVWWTGEDGEVVVRG